MALSALEFADRPEEAVRCELVLALGDAEARGGSFGAAQETFVRAAELARKLGCGRSARSRRPGLRRTVCLVSRGQGPAARSPCSKTRWTPSLNAAADARDAPRPPRGRLRDRPVPERRAALTEEALEIARAARRPDDAGLCARGHLRGDLMAEGRGPMALHGQGAVRDRGAARRHGEGLLRSPARLRRLHGEGGRGGGRARVRGPGGRRPRRCASRFSCGASRWPGVMRALQAGGSRRRSS